MKSGLENWLKLNDFHFDEVVEKKDIRGPQGKVTKLLFNLYCNYVLLPCRLSIKVINQTPIRSSFVLT